MLQMSLATFLVLLGSGESSMANHTDTEKGGGWIQTRFPGIHFPKFEEHHPLLIHAQKTEAI